MIIKNSNLRIMLFRNRYKILGIIIAIIFSLLLIQTLNKKAYERVENKISNNEIINNTNTGWIKENETFISGQDISNEKQEEYTNVIDQFIEACNNKEVEKAYEFLSTECKQLLYGSKIESFEKNYINRIFKIKKSYSLQSWIEKKNATYRIKLVEDVMSTGGLSTETIVDYYTIVKKDKGYKLNINSYIGYEEINKEKEKNGISFTVKEKNAYMEYEVYNIEVSNNTENTILLDSKETTDSVYLYGQNESSYPAQLFEVDNLKLIINPNEKKQINIKFNKRYPTTSRISDMVWNDIILNKAEYEKVINKKEYKDRLKISISI